MMENQSSLSSNTIVSNNKLRGENVKFVWKIDDFSLRSHQNGENLQSAKFETASPNGDKQKWTLEIYPKGIREEGKEHISLFINLVECDKAEVLAKVTFAVLNGKETEAKKFELGRRKYPKNSDWGFCQFIKRDFVLDKANGLLPDDRLTIQCNVRVLEEIETIICPIQVPECRFNEEIGSLLEKGMLTDCVLVSASTKKEFKVHKNILACRSPVFAAMFNHGMTESNTNRVEISDIDAGVLEQMLKFIYTGTTPILGAMTKELLVAADKYQIERLKVLCEQSLVLSLNHENVCELLILANRHSAGHLKSRASQYIKSHTDKVMVSDGWKIMTKEHTG